MIQLACKVTNILKLDKISTEILKGEGSHIVQHNGGPWSEKLRTPGLKGSELMSSELKQIKVMRTLCSVAKICI